MKKKSFTVLCIIVLIVGFGLSNSVFAEFNVNIEDRDDIVKIMGDIYIPEDKEVNGDVVSVIGNIKVDGRIKGDVVSVIGDIDVNNTIEGDVVSVLGKIDKRAKSQINGSITEVNNFNTQFFKEIQFPFVIGFFSWQFKIFKLIILCGLATLVLALIPDQQQKMTESLEDDPLRKLLVGSITLLILPIIFIVSIISLIGIPLIPVIMLVFVIAKFIGYVAVAFLVGKRVKIVGNMDINILLEVILGVFILWILRSVPVISFISYLIVSALAIGVVIDTKFGTNRPWFNKGKINE